MKIFLIEKETDGKFRTICTVRQTSRDELIFDRLHLLPRHFKNELLDSLFDVMGDPTHRDSLAIDRGLFRVTRYRVSYAIGTGFEEIYQEVLDEYDVPRYY